MGALPTPLHTHTRPGPGEGTLKGSQLALGTGTGREGPNAQCQVRRTEVAQHMHHWASWLQCECPPQGGELRVKDSTHRCACLSPLPEASAACWPRGQCSDLRGTDDLCPGHWGWEGARQGLNGVAGRPASAAAQGSGPSVQRPASM